MSEIMIVGILTEPPFDKAYSMQRLVYDTNGIAPTVIANWGWKSHPAKILVRDERPGISDKDKHQEGI